MYAMINRYRDSYTLCVGETMEQLIQGFSYTLEVGNSWKSNVSRNPKTPKSLISNLDKCDMVYGYYNSSYYQVDKSALNKYVKTLSKEKINSIKEDYSGLWHDITKDEFDMLVKKD